MGHDELDDRHFHFRNNLVRPNLVEAPKQVRADVNRPPADFLKKAPVKVFIDAAEVPGEKHYGLAFKVGDLRYQYGLVQP